MSIVVLSIEKRIHAVDLFRYTEYLNGFSVDPWRRRYLVGTTRSKAVNY